ncbi:MAG: IclR family transcriptional regulator [Desulfobacterales bacterium]|jgi:DNA-binding IclR family transcriptional regulator
MQSVLKAFKVLESFSITTPELKFSQIVDTTGLGKTNTHKLLKTLVSLNCIAQTHPRGPYRLGPKLFELGNQYVPHLNLRRVAVPFLVKLAEEFEGTAYLCIENNGEALCLERIDGPSQVKVTVLERGGRLPLHAGAAPLALLSGMDNESIESLMKQKGFKKFTGHTLQNLTDLLEEIELIRKRGYSVSWEDVTIGVASFGAPICDFSGEVIGAISIGGLLLQYQGRKKQYFIDLLIKTAEKISKKLGYDPNTRNP